MKAKEVMGWQKYFTSHGLKQPFAQIWEPVFDKDDVSIMNLIDKYTLAQVMEFINVAQEAVAVNVLALLLNYKKQKYLDFDPMEAFTLD